MKKNGVISIVLAGDRTLAHEGMRQILSQNGEFKVVADAADAEEAVEAIRLHQPHVALLDVPMPKLGGIELVRRVKACCPETYSVLLTDYDDGDDYSVALKEAGASACLIRNIRPSELLDAVRNVYAGEAVQFAPHPVRIPRPRVRPTTFSRAQAVGQLSAREVQVLQLAAQGLHNRAIAGRLGISVRTVEAHLGSVFIKLHVSSRTEAILHALSRRIAAL